MRNIYYISGFFYALKLFLTVESRTGQINWASLSFFQLAANKNMTFKI